MLSFWQARMPSGPTLLETYSTAPGTTCIEPRFAWDLSHSARYNLYCIPDIAWDHTAQHQGQPVLYPGHCLEPIAQHQVQSALYPDIAWDHVAQHQGQRFNPCYTPDIAWDHVAQHRLQFVLYPGYCWRPTAQPEVQHCTLHI